MGDRRRYNTSYITTHSLAKDLLSRPDGFVVIAHEGREYTIEGIKRTSTYANYDDSSMYWALNTSNYEQGNIKR